MQILNVTPQLRTTDLPESIRFYTEKIGLTLQFQYQDFYAGIRAGDRIFHLKHVDEKDPSIDFVATGDHFHLYLHVTDASAAERLIEGRGVAIVQRVHDTAWGTREFAVRDDQGHTVYFGENQ